MVETSKLVSIALFTIVAVFTIYGWIDRYRGTNALINEAFDNQAISDKDLQKILQANEQVPTDDDATKAHQTLLRYIKNDFGKGVKFVYDFQKRFFGIETPIRKDFDPRALMNNYSSPLQGI